MESGTLGRSTSPAEVTNVSVHGFWLIVDEQELLVAFEQFPWFRGGVDSGDRECAAAEPSPLVLARPGYRSRRRVHCAP